MRTMQDKVLSMIEAMAAERGVEALLDPSAANTGKVIFQKEGSFDTIAAFYFNFQPGYLTGRLLKADGGLDRDFPMASYDKPEQLHAMLSEIAQRLPAKPRPRRQGTEG